MPPVYKTLHASNISISKTVLISISCKPVSVLVSSEPVKYFVMYKSVCFSDFSIAKKINSEKYCSVTCIERSVNVVSSVVRKSIVSYRTACSVDLNIVMQTVNVTHLRIYLSAFLKKHLYITYTLISLL